MKTKRPRYSDLTPLAKGYIDCALWLALDKHGNPNDELTVDDLPRDALDCMIADCAAFQVKLDSLLVEGMTSKEYEQAGHDFYLTRNGHGAGFWDGDYEHYGKAIEDGLSKLARDFGENSLHLAGRKSLWLESTTPKVTA